MFIIQEATNYHLLLRPLLDPTMQTTTVSLADWMSSKWAFVPSSRRAITRRKSTLSQQVEEVYKENHGDEGNRGQGGNRPNEVYLENAAIIAFLLLEQVLLNSKDASECALEVQNITLTLENVTSASGVLNVDEGQNVIQEACNIKFVALALRGNQDRDQDPPIFQSFGRFLLGLFTRQVSVDDWESIVSNDEGGLRDKRNDSEDFESAMLKALSILDDNGNDDQYLPSQKHKRQSSESIAFSRIRNHYPSLPTAVCRLISDLVDGPSGTNTSFESLDDVSSDLEQMAIEPGWFLHEPSLSHLQLEFGGDRLYGRQEEVAQMIEVANNISSGRETGPLEIVSIRGYSGSGKSFLARQVGRHLSERGWIFIQGKFDRMRQTNSFSVVTSTFESYCELLQVMKSSGVQSDMDYCTQVSSRVVESLGSMGVDYLAQIIPSLKRVVDIDLGSDSEVSSNHDMMDVRWSNTPMQPADEAVMSQRRRECLLCSFAESILGVGRPIVLFLDDVQWAGAASDLSWKLLKHIAGRNIPRKHLMFIQSFRDDEMNGVELPLASDIESNDSMNITTIKLDGFSKKSLNDIISPILRIPRRITRSLSEIVHQKTMGNILFVLEFLKSLESQRILSYNLEKRRWVWDIDSIAITSISDSVAGLLAKKLLCIEKQVLDSLIIASCFGFQTNSCMLELLNGIRGVVDVVASCMAAVNEGLLERAGPLFMFAHDSLQEAV